jgi:hypothetical protein
LDISPDFSDFEKMDVKIGATCSFNSFNTLPCILSGSHALCGANIHFVPSNVKPKKLFSYIKSIRTDNSGVAPLQRDGILVTDTVEKADILNNGVRVSYISLDLFSFYCMLYSFYL